MRAGAALLLQWIEFDFLHLAVLGEGACWIGDLRDEGSDGQLISAGSSLPDLAAHASALGGSPGAPEAIVLHPFTARSNSRGQM